MRLQGQSAALGTPPAARVIASGEPLAAGSGSHLLAGSCVGPDYLVSAPRPVVFI
jgi:hypothetical protein